MTTERTCTTCHWLECFSPRLDEPSSKGCRQSNWAGYVGDPGMPPCGGIAWTERCLFCGGKDIVTIEEED